jgi:hypothetical protein
MDPAFVPKDHKSTPILPTFANHKTSVFKKPRLRFPMIRFMIGIPMR